VTPPELHALVDEHYGAMHRLARLVGDPAAARVVVRAAWAKALEQPETLTRGRLLGLVLAELQAPRPPAEGVPAAPAQELEADDSRWAGWWQDDLPATPDPGDEPLEAALASLPPGLAALLVLRDVERLEAAEVDALLGHSPEEQLVFLQHGRSALRSALRAAEAAA
jgi:hypothetical protein